MPRRQTTPRPLKTNDQLSTRERIYKKWGHNLNSRDAPFHLSCSGSTQERIADDFRTHPLSFTNCTCYKNNQAYLLYLDTNYEHKN